MEQQTGSLRGKYQKLIDAATQAGVSNLQVRQQENVLYIDGIATSEAVKQQLWDVYNRIDPDYRSADLIMNISVSGQSTEAAQEYTVVKGDNLTRIGKKYGVSWKEIFDANRDQIKDADHIEPGWKLTIPVKNKVTG